MNKRVIAAVLAAVLAVVGVVLLVGYVNNADERAFSGAKLQKVLQVKEPVPANTKGSDLVGKVAVVRLPRSAIAQGAVTDLADVAKLSTTTSLEPGEQLLLARFSAAAAGGGAPVVRKSDLPLGMQELTIPVDVARALGGTIKVGDTLGVVASYQTSDGDGITRIVQNRVQVIRISDGGPVAEGQVGGTQLVTFAVRTRDAGKIVNAVEFGKIYLTRQNKDTEGGNGGSISRNDVTQ
ncbi:RcpC/CpaB family pilus assembly protein [Aeromicrobium sp.]|uniref:Flp pilus assembly protein CpaB n=1 Tax=Aeromicrobium sp. TaxID=1871063 RepID=UPI0019CC10F4|nr:RcpC/CpaB family pilus assembly protein [Aeromicrobium sp.]MBC7632448.1 hypothetical protein [Aeromicrobium sp.]